METQNYFDFDRLLQYAAQMVAWDNDVNRVAIGTTIAALAYKRPILWLERELAEMLLRTELLQDLTTGDINWKWPAFRIVLPRGPLAIERPGGTRYLTHFDVCQLHRDGNTVIKFDKELAMEMDQLASRITKGPNRRVLELTDFTYKFDDGIVITSALDRPETNLADQTVYGLAKPWGDIKIREYSAVQGDLDTPFTSDQADKELLARLEHLVINVLLFLSLRPLEYQPEVLRHAKMEGRHLIPGLLRAKFVGDSQIRARTPEEGVYVPHVPTGRHTSAHWVAGHWKRQIYGPKASLRKLIWIMPYQTHDFVEPEIQKV
jgi:hypothetical protein